MALRHAREQGGGEPVAPLGKGAGRLVYLGAFVHPRRHQPADLVQLFPAVNGPDVGVFIQRVPHPQRRPTARFNRARNGLVNRLLHQQPAARATHMALIEENTVHHPLHRLIHRGVVEYRHAGAFAAQLQSEPSCREPASRASRSAFPTAVEPVKATLSHPRMPRQLAAPASPPPVTTLNTPGRQARPPRSGSAKARAVKGVVSAGFSTTVLPVGQSRGATFQASIKQRKIPGNDLPRHAQRAVNPNREKRIPVCRPSRRNGKNGRPPSRNVKVAGLFDGLAPVQSFQHRQLPGPLLPPCGLCRNKNLERSLGAVLPQVLS